MAGREIRIAIEGIIGAGKTTICDAIAFKMHLPAYHEHVLEDAELSRFYADMKGKALGLQYNLLIKRVQEFQKMKWSGVGGVQDRSIHGDMIFAKVLHEMGYIDDHDIKTYLEFFRLLDKTYAFDIDVIVFLKVSVDVSLSRIKKRARGMETTITRAYLELLHAQYEHDMRELAKTSRVMLLEIDWNDEREAYEDIEEAAEIIAKCIAKEIANPVCDIRNVVIPDIINLV
jgi:deoxyadenosine/deoxycytidine kinase